MDIEGFIRSTTSVIAALGALVAAIASLAKAISDIKSRRSTQPFTQPSTSSSPFITLLKMPMFLLGAFLMILAVSIFVWHSLIPPLPLHVQLINAAWDAYEKSDYGTVIDKTRECVDAFGDGATREQQTLIASGNPLPPSGSISRAEKNVILSRGILNDVAASYYAMGLALEELDRLDEAKQAYQNAQNLSYARVWDPKGWFWSPAEASTDRLTKLP